MLKLKLDEIPLQCNRLAVNVVKEPHLFSIDGRCDNKKLASKIPARNRSQFSLLPGLLDNALKMMHHVFLDEGGEQEGNPIFGQSLSYLPSTHHLK